MKRVALALCILALALPVYGQVQSGSIYGTVQDEQGGVLPGATVRLTGPDRTTTFVTQSDGKYRFLNLPPGNYQMTVALSGFGSVTRKDVMVVIGKNVEIPFMLKLATIEQSVTVTSQTPLVDTKTTGTATNFTQTELASIPTSRDPWALLRTVPGVMVDRVNIAGNETGQQSNFQAKGTRPQDAVWTLDGVVVTDMAAIGASPTYFNYDNFDEIEVATSGQDIRQPTGGVGLNFVVKRGTNQFRGGARAYFTNHGLEGSNVPAELQAAVPPVTSATADHNQQISDAGVELGGPIIRDHAWAYGSYSDQDIRLYRRSTSSIDRTRLKTYNVKGNWQATKSDMISVLWYLGAKEKNGRSPGTSGIVFDAPTATWNQGNQYVSGAPHGLFKLEDDHTFGSKLFVNGKYAYYNTGFGLVPIGGLDLQSGESQILGQSFGSTRQSIFTRPNHLVNVDANYFANFLRVDHELKFGGGWRRADASTSTIWPGNGIRALENSTTDFRARVTRPANGTDRVLLFDLYAGDTIAAGPLTFDAGVRFDRQWGRSLPSTVPANPAFPDLVPGVQFAGYRTPFTWSNVSPRFGVTWALDRDRKTLLRASYTRYAGQLENGVVGYSNITTSVGFADYGWVDANGDHFAQADEVAVGATPITFGGGFNPAAPTASVSVNRIDPNLKAPVTTSVVAGFDRELMPNLAVQANYTYTRTSNFNGNFTSYYTPWVGLTAADYIAGPVLSGVIPGTDLTYSVPTFIPDPAKVADAGNARMLTNWPGYRSYYHGVEASVIKRYSQRWMMRVGAAYNQPRERYGDPTNDAGNPTRTDLSPLVDGGQFVVRSGGSGSGDIFIDAKWQVNVAGMYMLPYDIELGANVFGRQGYPFPVYRTAALGLDGSYRILLTPEIDTLRLKNLWDADMRVAKKFKYARTNLEVIADAFNLFDSNTELVRNRNAASPAFQALAQNLSPRIVRFGVKVGF